MGLPPAYSDKTFDRIIETWVFKEHPKRSKQPPLLPPGGSKPK